jgi:hypothetical protein
MRLWARMDWPSLRRGYRRMRRQSVSQQRHVPASSANVQTDFWVRRQQFNPILVSWTKFLMFFVFKNLGERCEVNRDDCLPALCRITERVSIKWPITLAFVRLNSWDVIANKNSTLVPVCRVKMAPVASQHDHNPISIANVYQVNLKLISNFNLKIKL